METTNVFENISQHIIKHIQGAENSIYICVPWITDEEILTELIQKSKQKVHIEIITVNDEFNRAKMPYFNRLISNQSKVYLIDKTIDGGIPHHKFCIIDDETLITGSYNWSNNAKNNDENILIKVITDFEDYKIINDYSTRFQKMLYKYGIENENVDWEEVIQKTNEVKSKQKDASQYFDLTQIYVKEKKFKEALDSINEGIGILPYPDKNYLCLKHSILIALGKYLDGTEILYSYLWQIADNDIEEIERFKQTHETFIKTIKSDGVETYKIMAGINQKTKANLGKFALLNLTPHFFNFEELDIQPF
jgi:hypothetical protein